METKALIRKRILGARDGMEERERREKSLLIAERVWTHAAYRQASGLLCYAGYKSEVQTAALMEHAWKEGKRVYCPKVCGNEMEFYRIAGWGDLGAGYKGIPEPQVGEETLFSRAVMQDGNYLMIMPGCAFDKERNRIGYGGGYYDRYLEKHGGLGTMAICYEMQIVEKIPSDFHDRKPDWILTERHVYSDRE